MEMEGKGEEASYKEVQEGVLGTIAAREDLEGAVGHMEMEEVPEVEGGTQEGHQVIMSRAHVGVVEDRIILGKTN
jgi:hypothetical protein